MGTGSGRAGARRRIAAFLSVAVALVALLPTIAVAEKRPAHRRLPARAGSTGQAAPSSPDRRVEDAVARLSASTRQVRAVAESRDERDSIFLGRADAGYIRAVRPPAGTVISLSRSSSIEDPTAAAASFFREHATAFGVARPGMGLRSGRTRRQGPRSLVRLAQDYRGVPIYGGAAVVQIEDGGISFALADLARDDAAFHAPGFSLTPALDAGTARRLAAAAVRVAPPGGVTATDPLLMLYEPSLIGNPGTSRLVWHVRVSSSEAAIDEVVLVDAQAPEVVFHFSRIMDAKSRSIFDAANVPGSLGTIARSEGEAPTGNPDVDLAYDYLGDTYDFYFSRFGRDSYDGAGAALVARVRYCEPTSSCPFANAFWNGTEMRFGADYAAADDVVGHELSHAVTDTESQLIYWGESGAINESLSDIFGEFIDLNNTGGDDSAGVRWLMGEDLPGGAIRSMADPTLYGDPDRRFSPNWYAGSEDNRGVHINSGVGNKLAFLLTDGGSFNGEDVSAVGASEVARLFYEAQVNLLVPASDYYDLYVALTQAARNLGWTSTNREALERACRAVEIDLSGAASVVFEDGFEGTFPGSWLVVDQGGASGTGSGTRWGRSAHRDAGGGYSAYCAAGGSSPSPAGGPYKPLQDTWLVYGPFSLAQARAAWVEFDLWLDIEYPYDEIFWGISTDGSSFDGYAVSPGPDGLTPGWAHEMFNLSEFGGIVGQSQVWFAIQFVSDDIVEYEGAYVDNVVIRKTATAVPGRQGDSTGEGRADIVAQGSTGTILVLESQSDFFVRSQWSGGFVPYRYDTYVADVTGDGLADLISRSKDDGNVEVFRSTGSSFAYAAGTGPGGVWSYGWGTSYDLYFADVTGDGRADLVGRLRTNGDIYVFPSTGSGFSGSAPAGLWSYGWSAGYDIYFGDVTGDGRADLVSRYFGPTSGLTGDIYVGVSTGTGFAFSGRWTYGFSAGYDIFVGDMNGDGKADLLARYYGPTAGLTGDVYVIYSTGTSFSWLGQFDRWTYGWGSTYDIVVRDVNGDGRSDFVGRSSATAEVVVGVSTGTAITFTGTWAAGIDTSYALR